MRTDTDVIIAGAGPVGLQLAIELQRRGIDFLLLEQQREPSYFVKALGITPRTLEMWDQQGFLHEALDAGLFLTGSTALVNGVVSETQPIILDASYPYGMQVLAQFEAERILRQQLQRLGGAVEWNTTLVAVREDGDAVVAEVRGDGSETRTITGRYLAGCDGSHSAVRHALQLAYDGEALPMTFMLGDVLIDWDLPRGSAYRMLHLIDGQMTNQMVAIPIPGDPRRYRLSMAAPLQYWEDGADLATPPSLDLVQETATPMLPPGATLSTLRWSSFYRISHRIVPRYSVGRVFLAGDAAHIHPPIGGQGMNTGLQDAYNLGWKLALACTGHAAPDLLESYSAERQPVGLDVVRRTSQRMSAAIEGSDRGESDDQARIDSQLSVHYRDSRWVAEDVAAAARGPRAGERMLDAGGLRRDTVSQPCRLLELTRHGAHTLLLYADATTSAEQHRALVEIAAAVPPQLVRAYGIAAPDAQPPGLERIAWITDAAGHFRAAYEAMGFSLWLLRPDGYIAYRATPADAGKLAAYLKRIVRDSPDRRAAS